MTAQDQTLAQLMGEQLTPAMPFGQNMQGQLTSGYIQGENIDFLAATELGNGVIGPPQVQTLEIRRDNRPLAADELGVEGPWVIPWVKTSTPVEGKTFTLNDGWERTAPRFPGMTAFIEPPGLLSPFPPVTYANTPAVAGQIPGSNEVLYRTERLS